MNYARMVIEKEAPEEYGYDPDRFAVCGCSSGGNLSLSLGISDEKSPFNVGDNLDVSGQVQVVVDFFGLGSLGVRRFAVAFGESATTVCAR